MVQLIKCDLTSETVDFESSYRLQLYNRSAKTQCEIDVSHEWVRQNILNKVDPKRIKWQQWTTGANNKRMLVDAPK
jgi:hypothetical protein